MYAKFNSLRYLIIAILFVIVIDFRELLSVDIIYIHISTCLYLIAYNTRYSLTTMPPGVKHDCLKL